MLAFIGVNSKKRTYIWKIWSAWGSLSFWKVLKSEFSAVSAFARSCMARTLPMDSREPFAGMMGARQAEVKESMLSVSDDEGEGDGDGRNRMCIVGKQMI